MIWAKRVYILLVTIIATLGLVAASVDAGEKVTLRIASTVGSQHFHNVAHRVYAERIANRSNNRLEIRVLDGAQLGGERDYIEGMIQGSMEMAQVSTGPIAGFIPEFDVLNLPYIFQSTDHFVKVVSGSVGTRFFDLLEKRGIKGLCWFDNGYRSVYNSKRPVRTPADMKGLKIRVMESPIMVDTIRSLGGTPTPMPWGDVYTALQQGVLDGAEAAAGNVFNEKMYEVTKYYSMTKHFRPPNVLGISLKVWNRLSKEDQLVLQEEAKALQAYEIDLQQQIEKEAFANVKAKGMQINEINEAELDVFRKLVKPVHDNFAARFGPNLINQVLEAK